MKKKILFIKWNSFGNDYLIQTLESMGYDVEYFDITEEDADMRLGAAITEQLLKKILSCNPEFVFSFNYYPVVAIACKAGRIKYISWIYDNPYIMLYSQTVFYDTNRIFVFDSSEVEYFRSLGVKNIYYMPMAAAVTNYDNIIPDRSHHEKYDSDVTFIGSMYSEKKQNLFRHLDDLDDYTQGFLNGLMEAQKNIYGIDILEPTLIKSPQIVESMKKTCPITAHGDGLETVEWTFSNYFLARKVTAMERMEIIQLLSDTVIRQQELKNSSPWKVRLFTPDKSFKLPGIENFGKIDYYSEAPYAIKCAKINLNISLRSIHSGIPLRCMDLFGCGGFVLTNYQSDFMNHFVPGEDFVYYESISQIPDLIDYYLTHDDERTAIAANGYNKAKKEFSYEKQLERILEIALS